jgi:hypothetical protein
MINCQKAKITQKPIFTQVQYGKKKAQVNVVVAVAAAVPEDGSRFMFITINALLFIAL